MRHRPIECMHSSTSNCTCTPCFFRAAQAAAVHEEGDMSQIRYMLEHDHARCSPANSELLGVVMSTKSLMALGNSSLTGPSSCSMLISAEVGSGSPLVDLEPKIFTSYCAAGFRKLQCTSGFNHCQYSPYTAQAKQRLGSRAPDKKPYLLWGISSAGTRGKV